MRLIKVIVAIAICVCLPVVAIAHPGRTDSNGGHHDRSTGEYHYHHGMEPHQHSDMDGDGTLDCPYQFVDKTESPNSQKKSKSFLDYVEIACCVGLGFRFVADLVSLAAERKNKK